ncbi:MAG: chemotaxis protein CheD [Campylobacterales bacterium]
MYAQVFLNVGQLFVGVKPTEISTVLGSCVAVCLYDKVNKIGGMNHYLLPLWNGNGLQSPKFGNIAIPRLIQTMIDVGCQPSNMEAKVFGGANINFSSSEEMMIGRKNIIVAHEILSEYRIRIVAEDTAGNNGRRILMRSDTGKVLLKYSGPVKG